MVVPVEPVGKLGGDAPTHLVVLGAGGLVQAAGFLLAHHATIRGVAIPGVVGFHAARYPVGDEHMILPLKLSY